MYVIPDEFERQIQNTITTTAIARHPLCMYTCIYTYIIIMYMSHLLSGLIPNFP